MPWLLVENKVDLLDGDSENDQGLTQFAKDNNFCGSFRTSAKTGLNISESMEFLVRTIIKRMEDMYSKGGNELFNTERKSVTLEPERHYQATNSRKRKRENKCCVFH